MVFTSSFVPAYFCGSREATNRMSLVFQEPKAILTVAAGIPREVLVLVHVAAALCLLGR